MTPFYTLSLIFFLAIWLDIGKTTSANDLDNEQQATTNGQVIFGRKGKQLTIDRVDADKYISRLLRLNYPCLRLVRKYIRPLATSKFSANFDSIRRPNDDDNRIKNYIEFEQSLITCMPFYENLIERSIEQLGPIIGGALHKWMLAIDNYLDKTGAEGYASIILSKNIRDELGPLMDFIRETIRPAYADEIRGVDSFGNMCGIHEGEPETSDSYSKHVEARIDAHLMRAYHAGEGFCLHLRSSPFSHISYLLRHAFFIDEHLRVGNNNYNKSQYDAAQIMQFLRNNPILSKNLNENNKPFGYKFPKMTIMHALDFVCKSFETYPSKQLLKFLIDSVGLLSSLDTAKKYILFDITPQVRSTFEIDRVNKRAEFFEIVSQAVERFVVNKSCSWLEFYRLKRFNQFCFEFGKEHNFAKAHLELAWNNFTEKCTQRLLWRHRRMEDNGLPLWPPFPDNILAEQLVRKLEKLPKVLTDGGRLLQLLDTRTFGWSSELDSNWTLNEDRFASMVYNANEKYIRALASGDEFCKFYTQTPLNTKEGKYLQLLTELMYSMLNLHGFKLNHTNDGVGFFYMWRLCSINTLLPVEISPKNTKIVQKSFAVGLDNLGTQRY